MGVDASFEEDGLTPENFDAGDLPGHLGELGRLRAAVDGLVGSAKTSGEGARTNENGASTHRLTALLKASLPGARTSVLQCGNAPPRVKGRSGTPARPRRSA